MSSSDNPVSGPDLAQGIAAAAVAEGSIVLGHIGEEPALLVRHGGELFAVGATCTHYGGPLAEGIIAGGTVRCPWHHACFNLRTGAADRPPALAPVSCWRVEESGERVFVRERIEQPAPARLTRSDLPASILIIGGGAAGTVSAETLRREGYAGPVTILSADSAAPCDRPNLSKDYLAGTAPEEWLPLHPPEFYKDNDIGLHLGARVAAIDPEGCEVRCADGSRHGYGTLLLATGAEPVRLPVPGADRPHVHYLRTLADSRALIAAAAGAQRAVVVGASFIGLEVAASLRRRGLEVHVAAPESVPMERTFGAEIGGFVRRLHEENGVVFHLGTTVAAIADKEVRLASGESLGADLVVVGIGVRPATALA
ncbi:MAG: FAD-dependent oxidoreductase, partial [Stellaceae bacterium]